MQPTPIPIRHHKVTYLPKSERVIVRPFVPSSSHRIVTILGRAMALTEEMTHSHLSAVLDSFETRHADLEQRLLEQFNKVKQHIFTDQPLSRERQLLIGALFSGEYALESAALFNPSMVPHPDQGGVPEGGLRFILSLRATGEGHVSSIEFRSGVIGPDGGIRADPVSPLATLAEVEPNPNYSKPSFIMKLHEMGFDNKHAAAVLECLGDGFTLTELNRCVQRIKRENKPVPEDLKSTLMCVQWLADSNYQLNFSPDIGVSERVIFPVSPNESNGIEDARFVRFTEDDGTVIYYATYTAYNGHAILPQLIETTDFLHFRVLTLNGTAVQNKGMAFFPRRIDGSYAMLSRQDDENLFIMFSDNPHYWADARILLRPTELWESVKIGNCGSPIETEAGWLVITHGVGPMRTYCIGAVLLDLRDPTRVIGRLKEPLLVPQGHGREGYVPNVVYSCGSLIHGGNLILPYAMSDRIATIASIPLAELLAALRP
jgi:predicted GH43/DUF377 family glycosyl hydrolase